MIGIIDYGAGNIYSLTCCLDRVGANYARINSPAEMRNVDRFIIPGVGHAVPAMQKIKDAGFVDELCGTIKPVLGICLGMQLLTNRSEEGDVDLMGMLPLETRRLSNQLKVPHMGWNKVKSEQNSKLFDGLDDQYFYFVHSYHVPFSEQFTIGSTNYDKQFSAAIAKDNIMGVQFHPEKSGAAGEQLLKNFMAL